MADATLVVPVSDSALARQADAIVIGTIHDFQSTWDDNQQQIVTDITLTIHQVLKGDIRTRRLTIKQPGGTVGDLELWIDGAPQFTPGEKVLLFLSQKSDASLQVLYLYQGKFAIFIDPETGIEMAYREAHPDGVHVVTGSQTSNREGREVRANSTTNEEDYGFVPLSDLKSRIHTALTTPAEENSLLQLTPFFVEEEATSDTVREEAPFSWLSNSYPARWFEPDSGSPINMRVNLNNSPPQASTSIAQAFAAWSSVTGSSFLFVNAGSTTSGGMFSDGINTISFGDPLGQIDPPSNCSGVLAIGGYYRSGSQTKVVNGQTFYRILEGDLVFADGWTGCGFYENPSNVAEVMTHELGHVLGLGHSADSTATMYAYAHFDGRGAALRTDDENGLKALYPASSSNTAPACAFSVSPTTFSVGANGSTGGVTVTASASTCSRTAASNVSWITVTSGASGTGSGIVTLSFASNSSTSSRTGTVTVAGQTVTVTQGGATPSPPPPCSFSVSTALFSVSQNANTKSVSVTTSSSTCTWSTISNVNWITVTSGASGTGNSTVAFAIAANKTNVSRTGTLTVAGKTVTVNQEAKTRRKTGALK
ncbi:MAG: matrixin family metalloprotease [Candidatus Binatia bacterium]